MFFKKFDTKKTSGFSIGVFHLIKVLNQYVLVRKNIFPTSFFLIFSYIKIHNVYPKKLQLSCLTAEIVILEIVCDFRKAKSDSYLEPYACDEDC